LKKRPSQSLIEIVFILPLIIIILFGIVEYAMFFRNVSVVEDIATEAAVAASRKIVSSTMTSSTYGGSPFNTAVKAAGDAVVNKKAAIGMPSLTLGYTDLGATFGNRPHSLYQLDSTEMRTIDGTPTPIVTVLVDYRNPDQEGVTVQVLYQYRTLLVGAQLPVLGGPPIIIIPRDIPISSSKIQEFINY